MAPDGQHAPEGDPLLDPLWDAVEKDWGNEALHRAFVDSARQGEKLGYAASRYKMAAGDPATAGTAGKMLAQVALLAEYSLKTSLERRAGRRRSGPWVRLALLVAGAAASLVVFWLVWF